MLIKSVTIDNAGTYECFGVTPFGEPFIAASELVITGELDMISVLPLNNVTHFDLKSLFLSFQHPSAVVLFWLQFYAVVIINFSLSSTLPLS